MKTALQLHQGRDPRPVGTQSHGWLPLAIASALGMFLSGAADLWASGSGNEGSPVPWVGSPAGRGQELLPPWTPIQVEGKNVQVWGRTYSFGDLPFPQSIVARERELLAAPITLAGSSDGKMLDWKTGAFTITEASPARVRATVRASAEPLVCEAGYLVEYDGMLRCDLRLTPTRPEITLDGLSLEIPLRSEHARYLHFWPGRWGSAYNSRAVPEEGFRGPFKPFFWLGDEWRGLAWFAESDENIFGVDPERVIEVQRQGDRTLLRIHLIGQPFQVRQSLTYTFGLQATPVKPALPDAWDYRICHMGNYGIEDNPPGILDQLAKYGVKTICFHEHWTDIQNYPETTHGEKLHRLVKACHERGLQLLLYHGYEMSTIAPEWDQYHEECLVEPRAGGYKRKPEQTAYIVCYRSHWQDFLCEGIDKLMDEYGIDGVYLDGTSEPWGCRNQRHGCGYVKPDGSIGTTYPIFAVRETMRRIHTIVKKHNPQGQVNVHQSTCMVIPTLAYATSYWDGEQLQSVKRPGSPWEVLPLDAFRAEFMGHNWGVPAELLWYPSGPFTRREAMAVALLHDVPVRPSSMADVAVASRMWQTFDDFGRHEAQWIPYWESRGLVKAETESVQVSLYNRPGRGLILVAANLSGQECQTKLQLDLTALGQPSELTGEEIISGQTLSAEAGTLDIKLPPLDFLMVRLNARK